LLFDHFSDPSQPRCRSQIGEEVVFDQPSLLRGKGRTAFGRNRVKGVVMRVLPWSHQIKVKYTDDFRVERTQLISSSRAASIRSAAGLPASEAKLSKNSKRPLPALPSCEDFVRDPSPREYKSHVSAVEAILIVWFSRHCKEALRKSFASLPALPLPHPTLAVPYNILHGMYTVFDTFFLVTVLTKADSHDARIKTMTKDALGLVRTIVDAYRVDFWDGALHLWRSQLRDPTTAGGMHLQRRALDLLAQSECHSCLQCLQSPLLCDHACCRQQLLFTGLSLGVLTREDGYWRVSPRAQDHVVTATAPTPSASALLPPYPVTWDKLLEQRFPIAFPPLEPQRVFVRVAVAEDQCPFADLAELLQREGCVRMELAQWARLRGETAWLATMYRETKTRGSPPTLAAYVSTIATDDHQMSMFDLHCISLMMHVDVWVISPVWDGPPEFPLQLRASHAHWQVPAMEVACERKREPPKVFLAHINHVRPRATALATTSRVSTCRRPRSVACHSGDHWFFA
jgi:hypothetical protein